MTRRTSGHPDKTTDRKLLCTMSSCEQSRKSGKGKRMHSISVSAANEEMLNKAAENTPTATWGPANVYTSAY